MKAALYARKSTDDSDRHEDNRSITRQVERGRSYAAAHGWTMADEHVFTDDGVSGGEFVNRPGFARILEAAHRREFDVLVASEPSRLGRDMIRTGYYIAELLDAGVAIHYYLTGEQENGDDPTHRLISVIRGYAAEDHRIRSSQRARDALERKALQGYSTGGRVYGYENIWVMEDGSRQLGSTGTMKPAGVLRTELEIKAQEADVVRAIFRAYAAGYGTKAIAHALNGDPARQDLCQRYFGGQTPAPPWKGSRSWAPTSIYAMLHNPRYRGLIPFGQHRKVYQRGTKTRVRQKTFHQVDAPALRIIEDTLWEAVTARARHRRDEYVAATGGPLHGRPRASKHLLSGLMRCGGCSGPMVSTTAPVGQGPARSRAVYYRCSYRLHRGTTVCGNHRTARAVEVEDRLLSAIEAKILTPAAIEYVIDLALNHVLAAEKAAPDRRAQIETEAARLGRELDRLVAVITAGQASPIIVAEIARREERLKALEVERGRLAVNLTPSGRDVARMRAAVVARAQSFRDTLRGDIPDAREALQTLIPQPIRFIADAGAPSGYRIEAETAVGPLFAQVWRPQGDSNPCYRRERAMS